MAMGVEHRRHQRYDYTTDAVVSHEGESCECTVQDISASGASFKSAWRPTRGATVEIRFQGKKPVKGQVVRHDDQGFAVTSVWDLSACSV